ncbi:MAG TPA: hypothetical protein VJP77_00400, partial [Planctomycetota bacterium]|nr:hypothetical protein [Planctomycetota bacterium]
LSAVLERLLALAPTEPVRLRPAEVRRALVYSEGSGELDARKLDVFIRTEIEQQVAAGADPARFAVPDAELDQIVQDTLQKVREQYPDLEAATVLEYNQIRPDSLRARALQTQLFDLVYLPDDPDAWPASTTEAIRGSMPDGKGDEFIEGLRKAYVERKRLEAEQGQPLDDAGQSMFKLMMRQMVRQALEASAVVRTASDGLPDGVAMTVDGVEIPTDEVYATLSGSISDTQRANAERWVAKLALLEQALGAAGLWLDDEGFAEAYEAEEGPLRGTPFTLEVVVRTFKRFPSMETYKGYFRGREAFHRAIAPSLTDAELELHLDRANRLMGLGRVDAEVILCTAFDFETNRWIDGGWERAAARATEVVTKLAASGGESWDALLDEYSEFWDPPSPTTPNPNQPQPQRKNKGRLGAKNRNELVSTLGESDYTLFLDGSSVADAIFFDLEVGAVGGPWRGPHGYYIARVVERTPPARAKTLADPSFREMVVEDLLNVEFAAFARELLRR